MHHWAGLEQVKKNVEWVHVCMALWLHAAEWTFSNLLLYQPNDAASSLCDRALWFGHGNLTPIMGIT